MYDVIGYTSVILKPWELKLGQDNFCLVQTQSSKLKYVSNVYIIKLDFIFIFQINNFYNNV